MSVWRVIRAWFLGAVLGAAAGYFITDMIVGQNDFDVLFEIVGGAVGCLLGTILGPLIFSLWARQTDSEKSSLSDKRNDSI